MQAVRQNGPERGGVVTANANATAADVATRSGTQNAKRPAPPLAASASCSMTFCFDISRPLPAPHGNTSHDAPTKASVPDPERDRLQANTPSPSHAATSMQSVSDVGDGQQPQPDARLNQCVVRMTSGVVRDVEWRIVAKAHNATIAPVNVASAEALPPENAASPATSIAPPRTETSTM
jgi:hypothetical protein